MRIPTLAALALLLTLTACGSDSTTEAASDTSGGYPVTVQNCGVDVTFEETPERVVLLKSASVPYLHDLGVMDAVISRAGAYPREYYDDATWAQLERIPLLTDRTDTSGHLQISLEAVLALEPDLVLGATDNLTRETLAASGIPLLEEPALCPEPPSDPSFDDITEQLTAYGKVFNTPAVAARQVTASQERLAQVTAQAPSGAGRTAAVLYPTVGGGVTYAYGTRSMADPQLEAAGLENVFGDTDQRVFEVTLEELIGRDPEHLVLLYPDGDPAKVEEAITSLPGANQLRAVRKGKVMTHLFNFTEPPSPLAVTGLQTTIERFRPAA